MTPAEKSPTRLLLTEAEYQALLRACEAMDWRFRVGLVIAHKTGHRIGVIRQLRWSDIDIKTRAVRWRAEHEKTGYEHSTPGHGRGARRTSMGTEPDGIATMGLFVVTANPDSPRASPSPCESACG